MVEALVSRTKTDKGQAIIFYKSNRRRNDFIGGKKAVMKSNRIEFFQKKVALQAIRTAYIFSYSLIELTVRMKVGKIVAWPEDNALIQLHGPLPCPTSRGCTRAFVPSLFLLQMVGKKEQKRWNLISFYFTNAWKVSMSFIHSILTF